MKTRLDIAREEVERARANVERAKVAAQKAEQLLTTAGPDVSGLMVMAVAAAQVAYRAASAASEAAADSLVAAEAQVASSAVFEAACRAVSSSLRATVEATQGAVAALGVSSNLSDGAGPAVKPPAPIGGGAKQCAFCGTSEHAARLVAGPGVFICSECVRLCQQILDLK
jgi:hypothetical protein